MSPKYPITLTALFFSILSFAQPDLEYKRAVAQNPGEHAVIISDKQDVTVDIIKGDIVIKQDRYTETMYLDNLASLFAEHSVDYTLFDNLVSIEAATLSPKKNRYAEDRVKDFEYEDKISQSVFYDGGKSVSFLFPKLEPGHKTYVKYSKEISEPRFLPSFYFQRGIPVKEAAFKITADNDIEIGWKLMNVADSLISFTKIPEKNNKTTYIWKMNQVSKIEREPNAPDSRYYTPHIITWIKSYKVDGKVKPVLPDTKGLYSWYYSLVKEANKEDSPELKRIVDSLTTENSSELDMVKKVYYWVQDNIKYIAFEDGMGGFVPRSAKKVCEKRYGDCKDMASIISKMLGYAGIQGHLTWIGSRDIPYNYSDISTPSVDNHMICTYIDGEDYYFLDATGQYTPFGLPTGFIQGKEALISIDEENYIIHKVPTLPAEKNRIQDFVDISFKDGKISGTGRVELTGYNKINMTHALVRSADDHDKLVRSFCEKGSNKFLIESFEIKNLDDRDKALTIDYDFNIQDYANKLGNEIYINMNLDKNWQNATVKKDRKYSVDHDFKDINSSQVTLQIPKGYKVTYLPEDVSFENEDFGFSISYMKTASTIVMTRKAYNNKIMIEPSDFEKWNQMIKDLNKAYSEVIVLNKL